MPNVENCQLLLDTLRSLPEIGDNDNGFDMRNYKHTCGTPSCMAGFATWLKQGQPDYITTSAWDIAAEASDWLGIPEEEALQLFIPYDEDDLDGLDDDITPQEAAEVLQNYLDGGVVDWYAVLSKRNETPTILGDSFGDNVGL